MAQKTVTIKISGEVGRFKADYIKTNGDLKNISSNANGVGRFTVKKPPADHRLIIRLLGNEGDSYKIEFSDNVKRPKNPVKGKIPEKSFRVILQTIIV